MFKRVPSPEESREVSLLDATAVEVDPAQASMLFRRHGLSEIPPHLKRVKRMGSKCLFLVRLGLGEDGLAVKVPEHPPCTRAQFRIAREAWPCHYCRSAEETVDELQAVLFVRSILREVEARDGMWSDAGLGNGLAGKDAPGLQFSCGGGPVTGDLGCFCSRICVICDGSEELVRCYDSEPVFGHAVLEAVSMVSRSQRGYLCTGHTAYLYAEPCLSCAMALVHGRIGRVFCFKKSRGPGAPYSELKFNHNRFLNHRYNVYFHEDAAGDKSAGP